MCEQCYELRKLFEAGDSNSHYNYIPTLSFINEMVKQGRLELYAGDCPIEDVEKHLSEEIHYTIRHYFRCKSCNDYFFIGACIRGTPIYKIMKNVDSENFENLLWGKYGILFKLK
jgi:hypothetical protein